MSVRTRLVSYRLSVQRYEELVARARVSGLSPGGFAREALAERLAMENCERRGVAAIHGEIKALRSDLALATRGILAVLTDPVALRREQAEEWVRKNLNR